MATTRDTLRNNVRSKLDSATSGGTWGDELNTYLSEGQKVCWPLFPDRIFNSNSRGTTTFTVGSPIQADKLYTATRDSTDMRVLSLKHSVSSPNVIKGVVILPDMNALYRTIEIANSWTAGLATTYAVLENDQIMIGPVGAGDVISERYIKFPTEFSGDSACDLPDNYVYLIEDYAVYRALRQIGSPRAGEALAMWKADMAAVWQTFSTAPLPAYISLPEKK